MSFSLIPFKNMAPQIDTTAYIANNCIIVGNVKIGSNSSLWFNSVIRGDVESIKIGNNTNIQDGCVIHTSRFNGPVVIGDNVTIGHSSLIHACTIKDNAFIGMRSTIMDYVMIEEFGFVAAGSLVPTGKTIKSKELWMGSPAKFVRHLTEEDLRFMENNIANYIDLANSYKI